MHPIASITTNIEGTQMSVMKMMTKSIAIFKTRPTIPLRINWYASSPKTRRRSTKMVPMSTAVSSRRMYITWKSKSKTRPKSSIT